jgi:hypothetical protein
MTNVCYNVYCSVPNGTWSRMCFERSLDRFKGHLPMKISKFRPSEMALSAIFMESRFVDFIISKYLAKNIV